jgi:hypothetical protein
MHWNKAIADTKSATMKVATKAFIQAPNNNTLIYLLFVIKQRD